MSIFNLYDNNPDPSVVKRTERGWAGHHLSADRCRFRRNTLLELNKAKLVVSTVGNLIGGAPLSKTSNHYYETLAFYAAYDGRYWDADINQQVFINSKKHIYLIQADDDANDMHENVVNEITQNLIDSVYA